MKISKYLHRFAFASGLSAGLAGRRNVRRILMLHGIDDVEMPAAAFEQGIAWLARHFRIVPLGEMVDAIAAGRPPHAGGELALTFDDGLRNQFELAYPVLRRLGAPATFFVCPDLIEQRRWIWTQEARTRLQTMTPAARAEFALASGPSITEVEPLMTRLKKQPIAERLRHEAALRAVTPDFAPTESTRRRFDPLSWDELARIDPSVVTIGSHTLTHPILPSIDDAALEREIVDSRKVLEQRLGRPVDLFCYPNGSLDPRVHAVVARTYRAAVTTEYGFVGARPDLHGLHRIPATPRLPLLAWRMHRPTA
jgi:peptidoglycan/xylan/chitin deacetylase (PgdA/CDA1 family)